MSWLRRRPKPELTNAAYARWLRAARPPLPWFLGLQEIEQEALAVIGDAYATDRALDLAAALRDPELAAAAVSADRGDAAGEAELARRVAGALAAQLVRGGPVAAPRPTAPTMAGATARRAEAARKEQGADPLGVGGQPREAPA
jgi:hypothetical protein